MYFNAMLHQPQLGIQSSLWTEECQLTRHALRYTFKLSIQRSYTCHNKVLQGLGKNFCYEKNVKNVILRVSEEYVCRLNESFDSNQ